MPFVMMSKEGSLPRWFTGAGFTRSRSVAVEYQADEAEPKRAALAAKFMRDVEAIEVGSRHDFDTSLGAQMAEGLNRNVLRRFGNSRFVIRKEAGSDFWTGAAWSPRREDAAVYLGCEVLDARLRLEAQAGEDVTSDEIK